MFWKVSRPASFTFFCPLTCSMKFIALLHGSIVPTSPLRFELIKIKQKEKLSRGGGGRAGEIDGSVPRAGGRLAAVLCTCPALDTRLAKHLLPWLLLGVMGRHASTHSLSSVNVPQTAVWTTCPSSLCCPVCFLQQSFADHCHGDFEEGSYTQAIITQQLRPKWIMSFSAQIRNPVYLLVNAV